MAWAVPTLVQGFINTKTAGTTISASAASFAAGDTIIVAVACDNTGSSTPEPSFNKPGGETASWSVGWANSPVSTSAGGVITALGVITTTTAWTSHTLTCTLTESVDAKAMVVAKTSGGTAVTRTYAYTGSSSSGSPSVSTPGVLNGDLVLGFAGVEANSTALTANSGTVSTSVGSAVTSGGGSASNVGVILYYRIATADATESFGPTFTAGGDSNSGILALQGTSVVEMTGTLSVTTAPSGAGRLDPNTVAGTRSATAEFTGTAGVTGSVPVLTATVISGTQIDLSWTEVGGAIEYELERDEVLIMANNELSYQDTGLSPGTTYSYRVRARTVL